MQVIIFRPFLSSLMNKQVNNNTGMTKKKNASCINMLVHIIMFDNNTYMIFRFLKYLQKHRKVMYASSRSIKSLRYTKLISRVSQNMARKGIIVKPYLLQIFQNKYRKIKKEIMLVVNIHVLTEKGWMS